MSGSELLPRWDLRPIYEGFTSEAYGRAKDEFKQLSAEFEQHCALAIAPGTFRAWLAEALKLEEGALSLAETLGAYAYAAYSADTRDATAMAELNSIEELGLPLKRAGVAFRNALAAHRDEALALAAADRELSAFRFHIEDELFWQARQMSPELEDLAADLARSGGDAWGRLQESVSSVTGSLWDGQNGERKTIVQLRSLALDPDRSVREKAYRKELEAWKSVEIPLAAALNGVKGCALSLNKRRGWEGPLQESIARARITEKCLEALIASIEESLPAWRRYLRAKARLLDIPACAFYDLFAPVGAAGKRYSWSETRRVIVEKFSAFSPDMGGFAAMAFDQGWLDAEPREGKVGGAYCIDFPRARMARVLCNFEGSFSSLITVAHELGHAYHQWTLKDEPYVLSRYPMTLAETASIFAETVVYEEALSTASGDDKLGLLEMRLQDGCQVLVDILSRYYFETGLFAKRAQGELSPDELCALMLDAQKRSYGDGLDNGALHPYMWAVKSHYYSADLAFYNFPYAFGQLFGLGLYAQSNIEGPAFAGRYARLLVETGRASAVDVCRGAGFDIERAEFWRAGIAVFTGQVAEFEALVARKKESY
jgi:pepF/M3 family oligoendopeptidase